MSAGRGLYAYLKDDSGNPMRIESGGIMIAGWDYDSGQARLVSVDASGQIKIEAGITVTADVSGQPVKVSGETVVATSRSGDGVLVRVPTIIRVPPGSASGQNPLYVTAASGGVALASGDCQSVSLRFVPDAAFSGHYVFIGSSVAGFEPYSGNGFMLGWGDGITLPIDNFNRIRVAASLSGARVSYMGTQGF